MSPGKSNHFSRAFPEAILYMLNFGFLFGPFLTPKISVVVTIFSSFRHNFSTWMSFSSQAPFSGCRSFSCRLVKLKMYFRSFWKSCLVSWICFCCFFGRNTLGWNEETQPHFLPFGWEEDCFFLFSLLQLLLRWEESWYEKIVSSRKSICYQTAHLPPTNQNSWLVVALPGGISVLQSWQFLLRDLYQSFTSPLFYSLGGRNRYDIMYTNFFHSPLGKHTLRKINIEPEHDGLVQMMFL